MVELELSIKPQYVRTEAEAEQQNDDLFQERELQSTVIDFIRDAGRDSDREQYVSELADSLHTIDEAASLTGIRVVVSLVADDGAHLGTIRECEIRPGSDEGNTIESVKTEPTPEAQAFETEADHVTEAAVDVIGEAFDAVQEGA